MAAHARQAIEMIGRVFGRLTVIEKAGHTRHGAAMWRCRCACGGERVAIGSNIRAGLTKSCGCLRPRQTKGRVICDFAEPTLRLIHEVLLEAMHANLTFGDRGALLMIAEQMVARALGMAPSPCDETPLTDREVR